MSIQKKLALGVSLCFPFLAAHADVFIGAHPDDIELFMNKNASVSVYTKVPTVLVLLSAGDAGKGAGEPNLHNIPYYRSRLIAHEYAVRYWVSLSGQRVPKSVTTTQTIGTHNIEKTTIANVTLYNLNLPDGGNGSGNAGTGYQSLTKLLANQIASIKSVDGANTYTLLNLKNVLRTIISSHHPGVSKVTAHFQDFSSVYNPNDHADHKAAGDLVTAALAEDPSFKCVHQTLYQDYVISQYAQNLNEAERNISVATWGALNVGLANSGNFNTWDNLHNAWLGKQYLRQIAGGTCSF